METASKHNVIVTLEWMERSLEIIQGADVMETGATACFGEIKEQ